MFGDVAPLLIIFLAGYACKRAGFLTSDDGGSLLKVIFCLGAPAIIFLAITSVELDGSLFLLGFLAPCVVTVSLGLIYLLKKSVLSSIDPEQLGPMVVGVAVMNGGFLIPFVEQAAGAEGLARLAIIDTINGILTFSVLYAIVVHIAHDKPHISFVAKKLSLSPPLWAFIAGLIVRALDVTLPSIATDSFDLVARIVSATILIALGLKFELKLQRPGLVATALTLRFGLGAAIGFAFITVLGLEGLNAGIVMFTALAPIGFNSIVFSEMEGLDTKFAASMVSMGILIALVASPLTMQLLQ